MDVRLSSLENMTDTAWIARLLGRQKDDAAAQMQMKLVQKGNPVLPAVINVLQTASDADVRAGAATVIMCICAGTNPRQQEFAEVSQAIMKEGLQKPQPANLDGLKPLQNALANDGSWKVRAVAAQGLGYLGQESSAPLLGEALHDEHEEVRWWAAQALETVPSLEALDDLAEAANRDPSERVRAAAVRALGWVDSDEAVMPLIRATADRSSSVRQAAAEELARFQSPTSLQALVVLFEDPSEDVRWAAVVAAGELRDDETVPALIEAMRDPSPMVANAAERALQRMGKAQRRFGLESET
jgi:HEAT repeat protein